MKVIFIFAFVLFVNFRAIRSSKHVLFVYFHTYEKLSQAKCFIMEYFRFDLTWPCLTFIFLAWKAKWIHQTRVVKPRRCNGARIKWWMASIYCPSGILSLQQNLEIIVPVNPYPWILEKIQNAGPSPSAFYEKKSKAQHCIILYMFPCFGFFSGKRARWWSQKWHIFLFSTAYFLLYWHMPFEISIIR